MAVLKNEFSWSRSREELFHECRRKYYFHYYGSWGGWEHESDPRTRRVYMLKNLKTRPMWAGLVIQEAVQSAAQTLNESEGGLFANHDAFVDDVVEGMRRDFMSSRNGDYHRNPKSPGLVEHEYKIPVENSVWAANRDHVVDCLKNFLGSPAAERIRDSRPGALVEFKKFDSVQIEGVKVFAVPDICLRVGDEYLIIAPRSSESASESMRLKIACQILFLSIKNKINPDKIRVLDLDLRSGTQADLEFPEGELQAARAKIKSSAADMRAVLRDAAENHASEEDFAPVDSDEPCPYCQFRSVCPKFAADAQEPAPTHGATKATTDAAAEAPPAAALKGIKAL